MRSAPSCDPVGGLSPERHVPALQPQERDVAAVGQLRKALGSVAGFRLPGNCLVPAFFVRRPIVAMSRSCDAGAGHRRNVTFLRFKGSLEREVAAVAVTVARAMAMLMNGSGNLAPGAMWRTFETRAGAADALSARRVVKVS